MPDRFHHERLYRGDARLARLAETSLVLCGAGALGSHLADNLSRQGVARLRIIDRDRVEQHNVGTQIYDESEVGAWKAEVLRNRLFRATGVEAETSTRDLNERNVGKMLTEGIIVDTFDNTISRRLVQDSCRARGLDCVHVGVSADYGEVIWDENYRVPGDAGQDVCDYPLARNLILLVAAVASEVLVRRVLDGVRQNWSVTLADLAIRPLEMPEV
jgi:molybdopterin-synthase adenylyltransferase